MFTRAGFHKRFRVICRARIISGGIHDAALIRFTPSNDHARVLFGVGKVVWAENLRGYFGSFIHMTDSELGGPEWKRPQSRYPRKP